VFAMVEHTQPPVPTDADLARDPAADGNGWKHGVRPWQHDAVLALLLSRLALTEPIGALSGDLRRQDARRVLVVHPLVPAASLRGPTTLRASGLGRTLRDQFRTSRRYARLAEREARKAAGQGPGGGPRSLAHQGRLVTVPLVDTSRMTAAQRKQHERNAQVFVREYMRMVKRARPNLRLDNMRYHRPPSPTPEERLAAKKEAAAEAAKARAAGGHGKGMSKHAVAAATKDLDALFAV